MSFKKRIFYRIYPTEKLDFDYIKLDLKCNKMYIRHLQDLSKKLVKREMNYWEFASNGVFFNASQEQVYNEVNADLIENIVKGYNGVIICFGQTGSGKTFTVSGLHFSEQEFGLAPRIAHDLLNINNNSPSNIKICIQMSYLEFYNTYAVDLLKDLPNTLDVYKCRKATKVKVSNEFEALELLFIGEGRKNFIEKCTPYLSNVCSTVLTYHVTIKNMDLTNPTKICSRLHVIDLAGNDIYDNISSLYKNPKEIGSANRTKLLLEQFILRLKDNIPDRTRIQQRTNILLYYLDGDFSCENILRFVGHIKVRKEDMILTLSMLRFGNVIQGLKPKSKQINFEMNEDVELECLKRKIETYEKEKHLDSVLLNTDLVSGLNPPRVDHLNNLIQDYLQNNIQEITMMNVADTQLVLKNMKGIVTNCKNEVNKLQAENQILLARHSDTSFKKASLPSLRGSGSKISRRSSKIRSRESISLKETKASGSTISDKRISTDPAISVDVSLHSQLKRKKKSTTKKKLSNTSIERQDSKNSLRSSTEPIPDVIPDKKEIWKQYTAHGSYKDRIEEYKDNEKAIRPIFFEYTNQVKRLQTCKDVVNKCTNHLIMAQTYRKFNTDKDEYDNQGQLIVSQAEKDCKDLLGEAQAFQLEQQENVLRSQEELKVHLQERQNILKKIDEEFDQFSKEHFKIQSLTSQELEEELKDITNDVNLEYPGECIEIFEEIVAVPEVPKRTQLMRKLKKLMLHEIEKRKRIMEEKKRKWKNT